MEKNTLIQKAKVGDTKVYQGKQYYVAALNAEGKPLWRQVKSGAKKTESSAAAAPAAKKEEVEQKPAAKKETAYDAPKPKVQYKTVKPADGVVAHVPEVWRGKSKVTGKNVDQHRSKLRAFYADPTKKSDDDVIKMVNNKNAGEYVRMIAYEEAAARGIPESKLDPSGTLKNWWDRLEREKKLLEGDNEQEESEEEFEVYDMSGLRDMDVDAFMAQFPKGDNGWADRNDDRVQKEFNKLTTLSDRQRYDAFLDYQRRQDPLYQTPKKQIQTLNRQLYFFMKAKRKPMFVSAGGAGAGKTTSMLDVAKDAGLVRYDPKQHKPGDGDYDFIVIDKDVQDESEFRDILAKHNGKLLVFDDKDKLLTSKQSATVSLMKSLADGNPEMRLFKNPVTGDQEKFTGQLLFITNKTMDRLNDNEDHKAIMSRASKNDIHFTINETIEVLGDRYKTMGPHMLSVDPAEEAKIREKLYQTIKANRDELDPDKFTVRKFEEALEYIDSIEDTNRNADDDEGQRLYGDKVDWTKTIVRDVLNKAVEADVLEKGVYEEIEELGDEESRKSMIALYKKNPKRARELFGDDVLEVLNGKKDKKEKKEESEEKITKSFMDSLGDMSLEEAEQILDL
jgi:hypothetical protein